MDLFNQSDITIPIFNQSEESILTLNQSDESVLTLNQSGDSIDSGLNQSKESILGVLENGLKEGLGVIIIFQIICYGLISILGTVGNCLFLFAVVTTPQLRNPCIALVTNLCLTDLLTCIVACPLAIYNNVVSQSYASIPICKITHVLTGTFAGVSILTLTVLACNRYVVIVRPHSGYRKFCQMKLVLVYSVIAWALILAISALPVINGRHTFVFKYKHGCSFHADDFNWIRRTIFLATNVVLPGLILVPILYALMLLTVRASANRVMPVDITTASDSINASTTVPRWRRRKKRFPSRQDLKLYKMPMVVLIVFSLCWAPYVIIHIIAGFTSVSEAIQRLGHICIMSNSAINPYVYALSNKAIQKAYSKIITRRL